MTVHTAPTSAAIGHLYLALETGQGVDLAARHLAGMAARLLDDLERQPAEEAPFWRRFAASWQRRQTGYNGGRHRRETLAIEAVSAPVPAAFGADPDATIVIDGELVRQAESRRRGMASFYRRGDHGPAAAAQAREESGSR